MIVIAIAALAVIELATGDLGLLNAWQRRAYESTKKMMIEDAVKAAERLQDALREGRENKPKDNR